jgi:glycosyltransferase involved in cell wall biosynthesis
MSSNPLITIVLLTYKRPKLLKRAIQSALNQTYPHFKICVHDDASGDETGEVVAEMAKNDSRIIYHCNPQNLGVVKNSAHAWKQVDTPYFIELCDDNILLPGCLESALNGFKKYPEALLSANQIIFVNIDWEILRVTLDENCREGLYEPPEGLLFLIKEIPYIFAGSLFRSDVREKIGDYDAEIGGLADWDYVFRVSAEFPYVINKTPGVIFYGDNTGFAFNTRSHFAWPQWFKMYQRLVEHPSLDLETRAEVETHLKMRLKRMVVGQGKEAIRAGEYSAAGMSAQVLKDFFKSPRHYLKLKLISFACRWFPPYRWYLNQFNELRSKKKVSEIKDRFSGFQKYTSYLKDFKG